MARQPEGKIVAKIKDRMVEEGARPFKIVGSEESYQEIGIPDLLVCYKGWFIGAEVKQPGAPLRAAQRVVLHEIYDAGGVAAVLETVAQTVALLSICLKRSPLEGPICFDRGEFRRRSCKFE